MTTDLAARAADAATIALHLVALAAHAVEERGEFDLARALRRAESASAREIILSKMVARLPDLQPVRDALDALCVAGSLADQALAAEDDTETGASPVDVVCTSVQPDRMTSKPKKPPEADSAEWRAQVFELAALCKDAELLDLAIERAGSQEKLADISGLSEEGISRVKNGHRVNGFGQASREWMARFLTEKTPPPALPGGPGRRPQAGAVAPQIRLNAAAWKQLDKLLSKLGERTTNQIVAWCLERYLERYPSTAELPAPAPLQDGWHVLRTRLAAGLLARFEARVGGPAHRAEYLRAALEMILPTLNPRDLRAAS